MPSITLAVHGYLENAAVELATSMFTALEGCTSDTFLFLGYSYFLFADYIQLAPGIKWVEAY
jgi:hypothetical protein